MKIICSILLHDSAVSQLRAGWMAVIFSIPKTQKGDLAVSTGLRNKILLESFPAQCTGISFSVYLKDKYNLPLINCSGICLFFTF